MVITLGQLRNGIGFLQIEISAIDVYTRILEDTNSTVSQKATAKTEIRNRLKAIYRLLNTVAKKEGFTPNTDSYSDQELTDRKIK